MIQHVCDRCGKVIEPYKDAIHIEIKGTGIHINEKELCRSYGGWLKRFLACKSKTIKEVHP